MASKPRARSTRERPAKPPPPTARAVKRKKLEATDWEARFPRSARVAKRGAESEVDYTQHGDVVQGIPPARCAMRMEERFATRVCDTVVAGKAVAGLFGVDVEKGGLEIMDEEEESMYQFWDGGKRVPPVGDWRELQRGGGGFGGYQGRVWEMRAADLRDIYGVGENVVSAKVAHEWWSKFDGWRGLVTAIGKMRKWRDMVEEEECVRAYEHMRVHREWVRECIKRYEQNVGRGMEMLEKRIDAVRRRRTEREREEEKMGGDEKLKGFGTDWGLSYEEVVEEGGGGSDSDSGQPENGIVLVGGAVRAS